MAAAKFVAKAKRVVTHALAVATTAQDPVAAHAMANDDHYNVEHQPQGTIE